MVEAEKSANFRVWDKVTEGSRPGLLIIFEIPWIHLQRSVMSCSAL